MKSVDLVNFFIKTGYKWPKDKAHLTDILSLTKTRVDLTKNNFEFTHGHEQTFFMKNIAEYFKCKNFFEIGTGRGTACYALSLIPEIKNILTVDIIPFHQKQNTAINFKPAFASNADLYENIGFDEKNKIKFISRQNLMPVLEGDYKKFDLCFIDGEHDNPEIIYEDFLICRHLMEDDGILVFDDYHCSKFSVKRVVDNICENHKEFNCLLVTLSGHLFNMKNKAEDYGMVIMTRRDMSQLI